MGKLKRKRKEKTVERFRNIDFKISKQTDKFKIILTINLIEISQKSTNHLNLYTLEVGYFLR